MTFCKMTASVRFDILFPSNASDDAAASAMRQACHNGVVLAALFACGTLERCWICFVACLLFVC